MASLLAHSTGLGAAASRSTLQRPGRAVTSAPAPRRRLVATPPTAIDPASTAVYADAAQSFGLTLMGMGIVAAFATGGARALQRDPVVDERTPACPAAAAAHTGIIANPPVETILKAESPAADNRHSPVVSMTPAAPTRLVPSPAEVAAPSVNLHDIQRELQQAAASAVAAVKTAAEVDSVPVTNAAAPTEVIPNGDAVRPGMTVQDATKQVQDWIHAWRAAEDESADQALVEGGSGRFPECAPPGPEPAPQPSAAALLDAMTADAPVANSPVGLADPMRIVDADEPLTKVLVGVSAQRAAPAEPEQAALETAPVRAAHAARDKVTAVMAGYQSKIEGLWASYEAKKARETELLAKSERILANLAVAEAREAQVQEAQAAAAEAAQRQSAFALLLARVVAVYRLVKQWVAQLVARLTSRSDSAFGF